MQLRFFIFLFLISIAMMSQNYTLKAVPVRNELNTYLITSEPFVDRDGFVWYAANTEGIFYRFDGRNKIKYSFQEKNKKRVTVSTSIVYSWIQDGNGNIWAINLSGAYIIDIKKSTVRFIKWAVKVNGYRDFNQVSSLKDKKDNIWISVADNYIIKFDKKYNKTIYDPPVLAKSNKVKKVRNEIFDKEFATLKVVKELNDGKILIQSDFDFYVINNNGFHHFASFDDYDKQEVSSFHFAFNGEVFEKNKSGTYRFMNKDYKYSFIKELGVHLFYFPFNSFVSFDSRIFTVKDNKFLLITNNIKKNVFTIRDSVILKSNILKNTLFKDINNIFWFSTYDNIFMLKPTDDRLKKYLQYKDKQISTRGIISNKKGDLYVGSYFGLFEIKSTDKIETKIYDPNCTYNYFNSLIIERDTVLWAIGEGCFIKSVNLKSKRIETFQFSGQDDFKTTFIKHKDENELWVGTDRGLFVFNTKYKGFIKIYLKGLSLINFTIYDLLKTKIGDIWLATNKGLLLIKKGNFDLTFNKKNYYFKDKIILILHEDSMENILVGTNDSGLAILNQKNNSIQIYDQTSGLSNNTVCGILESKDKIWLSTFYGMSCLDKKSKKFNNFYLEDGLPENEFNTRSHFKQNDSVFYFGGLNGFLEFNPNNFKIGDKKNKIYLSKSEYFAERKGKNVVDFNELDYDIIVLPHDRNFFSAEFSINDMYDYDKATYYYKIEGLNNDWMNAGLSGFIKLYNLPAGDYTLIVKGKDFEGFETINEVRIPIKVKQIFYKSTFFIIFISVFLFLLMFYIFQRRVVKDKQVYEREMEIITLKSNALKAQMNPHFIFNILSNMQSIMILKGEEEANRYFGAFSRLLRLTLDMSKQEKVSLKDEIDYIKYYLLLNNLQLNGKLIYSIKVEDSVTNIDNIYIPGMLIQPFVENAIIHGLTPKEEGEKKIDTFFFIDNGYLVVSIHDNGIGRVASSMLVKNKNYVYKSWSTTIVKERISVLNSKDSNSIFFEIIDLENDEISVGTKVIIKFKINGV